MSSEITEIVDFAASPSGRELMRRVHEHELPPVLEELVAEYVTLDGARDRFMWQWVHQLAPQNTLPPVEPEFRDKVAIDKTLTILYVTLLDDVLEKRRDRATFEEAAKVPFPHRNVHWERPGLDIGYVEFTMRVWQTLQGRLEEAPAYDEYARLFEYDLRQAINAIEYTHLVIDRPDLATMHDLELYESHNMVMFGYLDIDLMHARRSLVGELPALRRAIWTAQQMARIGNWLSTWERELHEGDYSSGIVVHALQNDVISRDDIAAVERGEEGAAAELIQRIQDEGIEEQFLSRWDVHHDELVEVDRRELDSMDLGPFIDGLKTVLRYHLASRGLK